MRDTLAGTKRQIHFDFLRVIACFSVVMLHVASQFWYTLPITSQEWKIANSYNAIVRFGVPIFVMISGALFLEPKKEIEIKKLYIHNILRLGIFYILWSCFYGLFDSARFGFSSLTIKEIIKEMIYGRYHLWFLPMLIGIYILLPILKEWLQNSSQKILNYFLILFCILQIGIETIKALFEQDELQYLLGFIQIEMICSYVGYFVLGYYIAHIGILKKWHKFIYLGAVVSVFGNVFLGNYLPLKRGVAVGAIYDSYGIFTFVFVVALFLFFVDKISKIEFSDIFVKIMKEISAATLGIYVIHIGLIEYLEPRGIHSMMMPIFIGIPMFALVCFGICMIIAMILRRIPIIGKYIC